MVLRFRLDSFMSSVAHLLEQMLPRIRANSSILFFLCFNILCSQSNYVFGKVRPSIIIASVEGEAHTFSIEDELKVTITPSSIGKKIMERTILTTGKGSKVGLLFSNGTLITVKSGSKFYVRKYEQMVVSSEEIGSPSTLEEEPSESKLLAHLAFGELIVKAPKLKKGSEMTVTSPLGTAGIRGTMFQLVAVRNTVTGDVSGGINLISGDISFTGVNGDSISLFSGQSIQVAASKLGEPLASQSGGLVDLSGKYASSLAGDSVPPTIDVLFPEILESGESGSQSSTSPMSDSIDSVEGWEVIHELASEIFFEIEDSENQSSDFTFDEIASAVTVDVPSPQVETPSIPVIAGGTDSATGMAEELVGTYPNISLLDEDYIEIELMDKDFANLDPGVEATNFLFADISSSATLLNPPNLLIPGTYTLNYEVSDSMGFTNSVARTVEVIVTKPTISVFSGKNGFADGDESVVNYLVKPNFSEYPESDLGEFRILSVENADYPYYQAKFYDGESLSSYVEVSNDEFVDYSTLDQESQVSLYVSDYPLREVKMPDGSDVSSSLQFTVRIVDDLPPILSLNEGYSSSSPMRVEGIRYVGSDLSNELEVSFFDPHPEENPRPIPIISILDNYYSVEEIRNWNGSADLTFSNKVYGEVNMKVAGIYEIQYQEISDPKGNEANPLKRWVEVYDETAPQLYVFGANPMYVDLNSSNPFRDPGAYAKDNLEGEVEWESGRFVVSIHKQMEDGTYSEIAESSTIEEIVSDAKKEDSVNDTYQIRYYLEDPSGNIGEASREIILINSPFKYPTIIMHGDNPLYHEVNTDFLDPGVTAFKDLGGGLQPRNLSEFVTSSVLKGDQLTSLNFTKINYRNASDAYVSESGDILDDDSTKILILYEVRDEFNNLAETERELRIVDTTSPEITLKEGDQGINFIGLQGGSSFTDPGVTVTDNYDSPEDIFLTTRLIRLADEVELTFEEVESYGFSQIGSYEIQYDATDSSGNNSKKTRTIEVVDTIPPQVALISHSFLKGSTTFLETENLTQFDDAPIIDADNPFPTDFLSKLQSLKGFSAGEYDSSIVLTLDSDIDIYVFAESDQVFISSPEDMSTALDEKGRTRGLFSGFYIKDLQTGETIFEDPGVYARNDTTVDLVFSSVMSPIFSTTTEDSVASFKVTYSISQASGEGLQLYSAKTIYLIDSEKPWIEAEPNTNLEIVVEASRDTLSTDRYTDMDGSNVTLYDPNSDDPYAATATLNLSAKDALDGTITDRIKRKIKDEQGNLLAEINSNSAGIGEIISAEIDAVELDKRYTIEYQVEDTPIDPRIPSNQSEIVIRSLVVKDTKPPVIEVSDSNTTFLVDSLSTVSPDVGSEESIMEFMLTGLSAKDANDYDQDLSFSATLPNGDKKWNVSFDPPYIPNAVFPETQDGGSGYEVTIYVSDQSGNKSNAIVRFLKIGDYQPPTLTMIGRSEIHDFLRFASSSSADAKQKELLASQEFPEGSAGSMAVNSLFLDQPEGEENAVKNASGYGGGEHRILMADYNFVDPGVYAEDQNGYFDIKNGFIDLDGDGIGEGHSIVRVSTREKMSECTEGVGLIHAYSWFEKNNFTLQNWQNLMETDTFGFSTALLAEDGSETGADASISPGKTPDVLGENNGDGVDYEELDKSELTNFDMTTITIEYRVMDGWGNLSNILTRYVYVYESRQYPDYVFYATPLTDASGAAFEQYYDNNSTDIFGRQNPFLTSERKDLDGDGVSDFWELALGTDFKNSASKPDLTDPEIFKNLSTLGSEELRTRLSGLVDAKALSNVPGLNQFQVTSGL